MFVAEVLVDITAGEIEPAVQLPDIDKTPAVAYDIPAAPAPVTLPVIVFVVAEESIATAPVPPKIVPLTVNDVPENNIPLFVGCVVPPVTFPATVMFPAVCVIPVLLAKVGELLPTTFPVITVLPADDAKHLQVAPFVALIKLPIIVIVPDDVFDIQSLFEGVPVKVGPKSYPFKFRSQLPECRISTSLLDDLLFTLPPKLIVTVPVVAVTVIKLVAPGTNEVLATVLVQLPLILPLLKLNDPPATIALAEAALLNDKT